MITIIEEKDVQCGTCHKVIVGDYYMPTNPGYYYLRCKSCADYKESDWLIVKPGEPVTRIPYRSDITFGRVL